MLTKPLEYWAVLVGMVFYATTMNDGGVAQLTYPEPPEAASG